MKRVRETPEVAAGVCRMAAALGRRIGAGDPVDLAELIHLQQVVDQALRHAVTEQRELFSWAEIAAGLGTSRQAAQMRFGSPGKRQAGLDTKSTTSTSPDPTPTNGVLTGAKQIGAS